MPRERKAEQPPRLYNELADWFHLLTAPEDYREEAEFYRQIFAENCKRKLRTLLELGSGGGNNASHLKSYFKMTLVDLSAEMLYISHKINPECEHLQGDMRNVRLGRQFDAVFIHDAISYLTTETDLAEAIETPFIHCQPGGAALFVPDYVREAFYPSTSHGGHDANDRGMRYLAWTWDPDPDDTSYIMDFAYLFKEGESVTSEIDRHVMGLFSKEVWQNLINKAGFIAKVIESKATWSPPTGHIFLGIKPER